MRTKPACHSSEQWMSLSLVERHGKKNREVGFMLDEPYTHLSLEIQDVKEMEWINRESSVESRLCRDLTDSNSQPSRRTIRQVHRWTSIFWIDCSTNVFRLDLVDSMRRTTLQSLARVNVSRHQRQCELKTETFVGFIIERNQERNKQAERSTNSPSEWIHTHTHLHAFASHLTLILPHTTLTS